MRTMIAVVLAAGLLGLVGAGAGWAADIVTVPTANQLKAGEVDLAYYYLWLDMPPGAPQNVQAQTLYAGVTDWLEIDLHRYDLDTVGNSTIWNATALVLKETRTRPNVVIGGRNLGEQATTPDPRSANTSYHISAAKTLFLPEQGPPQLPIIRLHLSLGTEDWTLLGERRHQGVFGGVQMLFTPQLGLVVLDDSRNLITGLTYTRNPRWPTIKGGSYGRHRWVGISYTFSH